jgi:hypothetical protein
MKLIKIIKYNKGGQLILSTFVILGVPAFLAAAFRCRRSAAAIPHRYRANPFAWFYNLKY